MMATSKPILISILAFISILGLIDAWAGRQSYVGGDAVTYMDMARGIAAGNFDYAVNGNFSPLYPAILAVFIRPFQSSSLLEFSAVRVANMLIFGITLYAFHIFLTRFLDHFYRRFGTTDDSTSSLSRQQFTIVAYILIAWSCFSLTIISRVNPDVCVAAFTFVAASILLAFKDGQVSNLRFALFGAVLGFGYLCKAIFFPVSFLFVLAAAVEPKVWAVKHRLVLSLAAFFLIASPLAIALSAKYGHPTFGESGKLAYLQEVQDFTSTTHWQGSPETGVPAHTDRYLMENPGVFEFATPFNATYPPWFDPIYWTAGVIVRFGLSMELVAIVKNILRIANVVVWLAIPFVLALSMGLRNVRISLASVSYFRSLWLAGIAAPAVYLPIYVTSRYLAGSLPILAILTFAAVRFTNQQSARRFGVSLPLLFALAVAIQSGPRLAEAASVIVRTHGDVRDENWAVATEFSRLGIRPGTPVAAIDHFDDEHWSAALICDWAFLARVRVVSEVFQPGEEHEQFWGLPADRQAAALNALRQSGAQWAVASGVPDGANTTDWTQIQNTRYFYRSLQ